MITLIITSEEYERMAMGLHSDESIIVTKYPQKCACDNEFTCGYFCTTHNKYICNSHFTEHYKCRIMPNYHDTNGERDILHTGSDLIIKRAPRRKVIAKMD